jgi:hypothetical protein
VLAVLPPHVEFRGLEFGSQCSDGLGGDHSVSLTNRSKPAL